MKTLIVNTFGQPGCGKSTAAAWLFAQLKLLGISAELITEYAKDFVWDENYSTLRNQLYLMAEGTRKLNMLDGKVRVIVNENGMLTHLIYLQESARINTDKYKDYVLSLDKEYGGMNILLDRPSILSEEGARLEVSIEETQLMKEKVKQVLALSSREMISVKTCDEFLTVVLKELKNYTD